MIVTLHKTNGCQNIRTRSTYKLYNYCQTLHSKYCNYRQTLRTSCDGSYRPYVHTLHTKCTITVKRYIQVLQLLSNYVQSVMAVTRLNSKSYMYTLHLKCTTTVKLYIQSVQLLSNSTYKLWWQLHAVVISPVSSHWCRPMALAIPYRYVNNNNTKKHWSVFWSRCWRLNKAAMKSFPTSYYRIITFTL